MSLSMGVTMARKIAVVVRDRQGEALRMAIGIILMDDEVDIYVLDRVVEPTEQNLLSLETIGIMEMKAWTNVRANDTMEYLSMEEIAGRLLLYDHVLHY
ncbi:MAG TPA: hypothetical protein ENI89_02295 [Desulfobulbus sp.]|nr:hypothetical protein [Desulfobulbus sp.]